MPEIRECIASFIYLESFFQWCIWHNINLQVLGLWADYTGKDSVDNDVDTKVYKLDASSTAVRGQKNHAGSLWPSMWLKSEQLPDPPPITQLVLLRVSSTNRAIILDFKHLHFQVCIYTQLIFTIIQL